MICAQELKNFVSVATRTRLLVPLYYLGRLLPTAVLVRLVMLVQWLRGKDAAGSPVALLGWSGGDAPTVANSAAGTASAPVSALAHKLRAYSIVANHVALNVMQLSIE
eukprot:SAG11_NODE_2251_length_3633_cov_15.438031_2_plen_108_part_00